jgi:hypothetical protein
MPPLFRQSPAAVDCDKNVLRWPGPFGPGFLSPQPPGVVRIGPVAVTLFTRASASWSFFLLGTRFFGNAAGPPTDDQPPPQVPAPSQRDGAPGATFEKSVRTAAIRGAEISAAMCRPRLASAPAGRGCRPEHRRRRRRRRRARRFRWAPSSFRHCRSSRPPSTGSAPRCNR